MAYFSDATMAEDWRQQWCERCIHGPEECRLWEASFWLNDEALLQRDHLLNILMPTEGGKITCRMFIAKEA